VLVVVSVSDLILLLPLPLLLHTSEQPITWGAKNRCNGAVCVCVRV